MAIARQRYRVMKWLPGLAAVGAVLLLSTLLPWGSSSRAQGAAAPPPFTAAKAYVGLFAENALAVFDTRTDKVLTKITIPAGPHGLLATPDGKTVYVSSDGASTVSIIDTATDTVTGSIEVGQGPNGLAITPDGKYVLVAGNGTDQVLKIDTATNKVLGKVPVPKPHNIAISPDGKLAYVGSQQPDKPSLVILNVDALTPAGMVALDKVPRGLNFSRDGSQLYFTEAGVDAVLVLNPATNTIITQILTGASPHIAIFPVRNPLALVVVQGPALLSLINPTTEKIVGNVPVGKLPHWVATTPDGDTAFVTNEEGNSVSVINLKSRKVVATLPIGNAPRQIIVVPPPRKDPGVAISNFAYAPATLTIKAGEAVSWVNKDTVPHTVTGDNGKWGSGNLPHGATFTQIFPTAGRYPYHCAVHPYMHGTVLVK